MSSEPSVLMSHEDRLQRLESEMPDIATQVGSCSVQIEHTRQYLTSEIAHSSSALSREIFKVNETLSKEVASLNASMVTATTALTVQVGKLVPIVESLTADKTAREKAKARWASIGKWSFLIPAGIFITKLSEIAWAWLAR